MTQHRQRSKKRQRRTTYCKGRVLVSIATPGDIASSHHEPPVSAGHASTDDSLEDVTRRISERYFRQLAGHDTSGVYDLFINQVERGLLRVVLEHTPGNQTRAAEILGINRGTLRKKLRLCDLR